ncbi:MAG: hypothetical protein AAGA38_10330 [Pseudomonadota bacterium]
MTEKPKTEEQVLENFLATERDMRIQPSDDFLARVEADALRVQRSFRAPPKARTAAARGLNFGWSGWGRFAGLTACLVVGVSLGSGFSGQIGAFGDYYLSGGAVASEGLFPTGIETLLTGEEG